MSLQRAEPTSLGEGGWKTQRCGLWWPVASFQRVSKRPTRIFFTCYVGIGVTVADVSSLNTVGLNASLKAAKTRLQAPWPTASFLRLPASTEG